jgi:hypothetical protein
MLLLISCFGLFFSPEDGGYMFLRNFWITADDSGLQMRRPYSLFPKNISASSNMLFG